MTHFRIPLISSMDYARFISLLTSPFMSHRHHDHHHVLPESSQTCAAALEHNFCANKTRALMVAFINTDIVCFQCRLPRQLVAGSIQSACCLGCLNRFAVRHCYDDIRVARLCPPEWVCIYHNRPLGCPPPQRPRVAHHSLHGYAYPLSCMPICDCKPCGLVEESQK